MSHQAQRLFVGRIAECFPSLFRGSRVLEVGSLDVNGSIREFFKDCNYTGLDIAPGKGVDVVCQGQDFDAPDGSFDVVISCEAMEHNPFWAETFQNMVRLCRPGGLVVFTCAGIGRPEHGTARTTPQFSPLTVDVGWHYYENLSEKKFHQRFDFGKDFTAFEFWNNWASFDLQFAGIKSGTSVSADGMTNWGQCVSRVNADTRTANARKVTRYRRIAASLGGDRWFSTMRSLISILAYAHEPG